MASRVARCRRMPSSDQPWRLIASLCGSCFRFEQAHGYEPARCSACGSRFALGAPWMGIHMRIVAQPDRSASIEHSIEPVGEWTTLDLERAMVVVRDTMGIVATPGKRRGQAPSLPPLPPDQTSTRMRSSNDNDEA